jgi:hypothetical protein
MYLHTFKTALLKSSLQICWWRWKLNLSILKIVRQIKLLCLVWCESGLYWKFNVIIEKLLRRQSTPTLLLNFNSPSTERTFNKLSRRMSLLSVRVRIPQTRYRYFHLSRWFDGIRLKVLKNVIQNVNWKSFYLSNMGLVGLLLGYRFTR